MNLSKYTMELRHVLNMGFELSLNDYPIFDESYRASLNQKIKDHYLFHEIGFETVDVFNHYLKTTMGEIMIYFNQLYKSELLKINPLLSFERVKQLTKDVDNTTVKNMDNVTEQTINNTTTLDNTTTSLTDENQKRSIDASQNTSLSSDKNVSGNNMTNDKDVFYDTPNGSLGDITSSDRASTVNNKTLDNNINENELLSSSENIKKGEDISTNIDSQTKNTTDTDTTSNTSNATTIDVDDTTTFKSNEINIVTENGFEIPVSELLIRYRETFLNIDLMVINSLRDLFMTVY